MHTKHVFLNLMSLSQTYRGYYRHSSGLWLPPRCHHDVGLKMNDMISSYATKFEHPPIICHIPASNVGTF